MVFMGFIKFTGLPESKNGKNSHLKIFDVLLNPFTTERQAIFLLLEKDNLGIINYKSIKNTVIIMVFSFTHQTPLGTIFSLRHLKLK